MARIPLIDQPGSAAVEHLLGLVRSRFGAVPTSIMVLANSPAAFAAWWDFLSRLSEGVLMSQQIAVLAADPDRCGFRMANTSKTAAAAFEFAAAVVRDRGAVPDDVIALARADGLTNAQLIEVAALVSINTFLEVIDRLGDSQNESKAEDWTHIVR